MLAILYYEIGLRSQMPMSNDLKGHEERHPDDVLPLFGRSCSHKAQLIPTPPKLTLIFPSLV